MNDNEFARDSIHTLETRITNIENRLNGLEQRATRLEVKMNLIAYLAAGTFGGIVTLFVIILGKFF